MQALLFDLDGTLTNSKPGIFASADYLVRKLGYTPDPAFDLSFILGPPSEEWMEIVLGHYGDDRFREGAELYRTHQKDGAYLLNAPYAGIVEVLSGLEARGIKLYVATAKRIDIAKSVLSHFGLDHHFCGVYGSTPDGSRNDKAVVIAELLRLERLDPETTAMVGDRSYDMVGACKNGLTALGALWGYGSKQELTEHGAWKCFQNPQELLAEFATADAQKS